MMNGLRNIMVVLVLLIGVLGSLSQAEEGFHGWPPGHPALPYANNVAVAVDGSIRVSQRGLLCFLCF